MTAESTLASTPTAAHVGIVLAAGGSRRLGEPKQLLRIGGESLLQRAVRQVLETAPRALIVVLGAQAERLRDELTQWPVRIVVNADWQQGMASSLRLAAAATEQWPDADRLLVGVDQPALDGAHLQRLLQRAASHPGVDVLSGYAGIAGIPALLRPDTFALARDLHGDHGLRALLRERATEVVEHAALAQDLDTQDDVARARAAGELDPG